MYYINGRYYLMIAEGGTEYGHMVTVARSDSVWGPFTPCPHNPILSHRDVVNGFGPDADGPGSFQALGHADLTSDRDGRWWMVFHAIRPSQGQLHHIGRETMLAPVEWDDEGWPVVNGGRPVGAVTDVPGAGPAGPAAQDDFALSADFTNASGLSCRWAYLRNPHTENYRFDNGLILTAGDCTLDGAGSPTFAGVRQQHLDMTVKASLACSPEEGLQAGLTIFHTSEQHYDLAVVYRGGRRCAVLRKRVGDMATESEPIELAGTGPVELEIRADRLEYRFYAGSAGEPSLVGTGRSQLLSTECARGTFTGCFAGLFCQGAGSARFLRFEYLPG